MSQKVLLKKTSLAVALALMASNATAAGFQLNEFSSSGLGRAFSGESAIADNATSGSRNPATMTLFDRPAFSGGVTYINPDIDLRGSSSTGRDASEDNIVPHAWVPNLHFIMPLNEQWAVGASATTNFGLATEFSDNFSAGSIAGKTDLKTSNLNLSAAYRLNQHFSFGLGVNAVYADAKIVRNAGEVGPVLGVSSTSEIMHMDGKEWGYGWNAGILYELDKNNRFGLSYRSKVDIDFNGAFRSSRTPARGTVPANLTLNLPEMWEFSAYHRVDPQWAVHYSLAYTSWSTFQELRATDSNGQPLFQKDERFHDSYRIALGTTYYYDNNWTFRTGIAFDDSPAPADKRTISIPDQDRLWLSAGTTYAFNKDASVDVGVSYMHGQKVTIHEPGVAANLPSYTFTAKGQAWLYGVNFNYSF
ncbi:long-chain fatty acid transporter FadL [Dickeya dianthicola]|uniref:long-chain fatty acid transporter FadL n=1 Tax=Dickeya dianthicola TaxID=204039 RepID=UPI0003A5B209|nr:long-chain fatty acid transporter FadL [Dickeya dianthicola]MCI4190534.1 long-chain fatty acid transporter FadL [Dickeya dianthicola]MCI4201172.1 long-chain fatty acid transporter FadL [Dickeya dianthicola]MCI4209323.1 long-chain fatty acid transporter FadL [Dickeya dianthicola]MCI4230474.1 long-chain fatty acid transporter FadL [Dickeya dianthicola]MZG35002.1 long-chain fatty acid transporter FadL [Dickeya dianthicola]